MVACDSIMCEPNTNVYTHKSFPQVAFFVCDTFMCVVPFKKKMLLCGVTELMTERKLW